MNWTCEDVLGYAVGKLDVRACINEVVLSIKSSDSSSSCRWLACINPHSYVLAIDDSLFSKALHEADWLIPDGVGVVIASKILGGRIHQRVTGSDIFLGVLKEMSLQGGCSVFFLGSSVETLAVIRARMKLDFPNVVVSGTYSPPFKDIFSKDDNERMVKAINDLAPDVLWVGLTAPKQEKWLHEHSEQLNVKVAAAVGAVFDFYGGNVRRSSLVFQHLGLEWLPRLFQQPRRLWKRSFISAPIFLWHVLKLKIRKL